MRKTLTPDGEPTHPFIAGGFDADVMLNAAFGGSAVAMDDQFEVDGTVSNFRRSGVDALGNRVSGMPIDPNWEVELQEADITQADGTFLGHDRRHRRHG